MLKTYVEEIIWKLDTKAGILQDESGQDLIEYALVVALICFAAVSSMGTLANSINNAFSGIANMLNTNVP